MDYVTINKAAWDKCTKVHLESEFYDVKGFIAGKSSLNAIELEQVGEVKGKSLLHLQCHFGQDTLSWARLGAKVTGVDLSSEAIGQAKNLARELGLDAHFIDEDIYSFGKTNSTEFDIVFTSYGALCWLPDLDLWAETIAASLKVGGQFNLVEFHAVHDLLSGYSYFPSDTPDIEDEGTYTENCPGETSIQVTWAHSLSQVIGALIKAGIVIEDFQEYPYSPYNCFPELEFIEGHGYQMLFKGRQVPLIYSVKGRKIAR
ncbi:class I SAM-dependent methyltransferase [Shewanella salipaludis]|uniref:Class I SAM-dependent methyltransferase n=1 Tax=Shewanella salipaludis TaxID=2723052 RepID=A0A972FTF8_9GAMM|nr:class I SAM-dependent methyltransferase [Shewanella salipaludis]NMH64909.1 class I SAM-dependent methyltransferase [Shewanella salipaludis]